MARIQIRKKTRFEVFKRDKFTCQYCGRMAPDVIVEIDHINPVANGGDNDIMNLVTSCRDCNRGKGKTELSDDSIVRKQKKQIQELAEKNEQLEMMLEWRNGLLQIEDKSVQIVEKEFCNAYNVTITEHGKNNIRKWLKTFSVGELLSAIDICKSRYDNPDVAFGKITGICCNERNYDVRKHCFNYIKKAMTNKGFCFGESALRKLIYENVKTDDDFDAAKEYMIVARNYSEFREMLTGE